MELALELVIAPYLSSSGSQTLWSSGPIISYWPKKSSPNQTRFICLQKNPSILFPLSKEMTSIESFCFEFCLRHDPQGINRVDGEIDLSHVFRLQGSVDQKLMLSFSSLWTLAPNDFFGKFGYVAN